MKINRLGFMAALAVALGGWLACGNVATAQDAAQDNKPAAAQGKQRRPPSPEQQLERLTTELNLTDAQKPKAKELLDDNAKKMSGLRGLPQDERREKGRELRQEQNKKWKEILTPEQLEKYKKLMERRRSGASAAQKETPKTEQ